MPLGEFKVVKTLSAAALKQRDAYVGFTTSSAGAPTKLAADALPNDLMAPFKALIALEPLAEAKVRIGAIKPLGYGVIAHLAPKSATFIKQGIARRIVELIKSHACHKPVVYLDQFSAEEAEVLVHLLAVAFSLNTHSYAKHTAKSTKKAQAAKPRPIDVAVVVAADQQRKLAQVAKHALSHGSAANTVRDLVMAPANILNCAGFKKAAQATARRHGLSFSFIGKDKLEKMKAGAFLAVAQASAEKDFGIAKLRYAPAKAKATIALVGKGIVFDTGGVNLKPSNYMAGMKGDMGGAATVLGIIQMAAMQNWPVKIDAYLAISDNAIDGKSYRPDDVVTARNGTTIEIVDTDAEGRMVLSDTLSLCAESKPDMILDFATLTGANSRAVGRRYAGGYTNRDDWVAEIVAAGKDSGERVWPFPMDADYADSLQSTVADVKQCSSEPGPDHIEAAQLLNRFVPKDIPWLHIDLSCSNVSQAFGYFPRGATGFGLGFAQAFLKRVGFLP